jgi:hypothetical protein
MRHLASNWLASELAEAAGGTPVREGAAHSSIPLSRLRDAWRAPCTSKASAHHSPEAARRDAAVQQHLARVGWTGQRGSVRRLRRDHYQRRVGDRGDRPGRRPKTAPTARPVLPLLGARAVPDRPPSSGSLPVLGMGRETLLNPSRRAAFSGHSPAIAPDDLKRGHRFRLDGGFRRDQASRMVSRSAWSWPIRWS